VKYRKRGLVCQGNLDHKIWGIALMTALKVPIGICAFEKSVRYYAVMSAKKLFSPGNQTDPCPRIPGRVENWHCLL